VAPRVDEFLSEVKDTLFFLDAGFYETHKTNEFYDIDYETIDTRYCRPPANLPDTPESCMEIAGFIESVRVLDAGVGAVLDALDKNGLSESTLVIITTDHGLPMPASKVTLTDAGTGVLMMMRGPGAFNGGKVIWPMVSQLDLFPTICDYIGVPRPVWLRGYSMMPVVEGEADKVRREVFTELTYHGDYRPLRAIRTERYKYIRKYDENSPGQYSESGPAKDFWLKNGWPERLEAAEQLYDLYSDPNEACNLINDPRMGKIREGLKESLYKNMQETYDPLLEGPVPPRIPDGLRYLPKL